MSYSPKNVANLTPAVAGVVANIPVTSEFLISPAGSLHLVLKIVASSITVAGSVTAKLQTAIGNDWVDSKTVAVATANTPVYIKLNVEVTGDQTYLPLLSKGRVVITNTNASDTVVISEVDVLQDA